MKKKMPWYWYLFMIIAICNHAYDALLANKYVNTRWETWVIITAYLILCICLLLPKLKKYQQLFVLLLLSLSQVSSNLRGLLSKSIESYFACVYSVLLFGGIFVSQMAFIRIQIRTWICLGIVIISLGSLYLYPIYFPNLLEKDKFSQYPRLLVTTVVNIVMFIIALTQERKEKEKELNQLKQAQTLARLSSLKDQLSPHFLFNTLNTITSISHEESVKEFVDEVANIYRYVLQFNEVDSVKVFQEIDFITSYLNIIKSRMEGGIDFYINITNDRILYTIMPPLTLQILVENAIKHNTTSADKPLSINIFTTEGPMLVVQNYYQPKLSVLPGNETGLKNIAERYRLLYKKEIVVENKNGFFTVKLPIVLA